MKPWSPEWKAAQLETLKREWEGCKNCPDLCNSRKNIVMGHGNPDARIFFYGEMPGPHENKSGKPFTGPSGSCLDSMFSSMDLSRNEFFFSNLVACHPPEGRSPTKEEKTSCLQRLYDEIYIVDPTLIVAFGKDAAQFIMGAKANSIDKIMGTVIEVKIPGVHREITYDGTAVYHPAFILRQNTPDDNGLYAQGSTAERTFMAMMDAVASVFALQNSYDVFHRRFQC